MAKLKVTEKETQKAIIDFLKIAEKQRKIYFFRAGAGMIKTEKGGVFRSGRPGCPDIILLCKGKFIGLEVKSSIGVQSTPQLQAQRQIEAAGGFYYLVRSIDDVVPIINKAY